MFRKIVGGLVAVIGLVPAFIAAVQVCREGRDSVYTGSLQGFVFFFAIGVVGVGYACFKPKT